MRNLTDIRDVSFHVIAIKIGEQGLSKMNRNHIHMAHGLLGEDGVISGMRQRCDLYIHIDTAKAVGGNMRTPSHYTLLGKCLFIYLFVLVVDCLFDILRSLFIVYY